MADSDQTGERWDPPPQFPRHEGPPNPIAYGLRALNGDEGIETADDSQSWMPAGPVARGFVLAPERITALMGPLGSGKTTASFVKGLICAMMVPPSPVDGIRYARGVVLRDNYRNLDASTISTYLIQFPGTLGTFKGGGGAPATSEIDWQLDDGTTLHHEIRFAAIGDHNVKTFCDGLETTWLMIASGDTVPADLIKYAWPRTGRWPPPQHRPAAWREQVWLHRKLFTEFNAPDLDNYLYGDAGKKPPVRGFVEARPKGWKLFIQPGGLEPNAENRQNLPPGYYEDMVADNEDWYVKRFVDNKWGYSREGVPVYGNWNQDRHCAAAPLKFDPRRKLLIAIDGGRTACAVAGQRTPSAGVHILRELIPPKRMAAKQFGKLLSQWLVENFAEACAPQGAGYEAYADPATALLNDMEEAATWMDQVAEHADLEIRPAPSNLWTPRFEAVDSLLREQIGGEEQFQVDARCRVLIRGFNSGYRFGKTMHHGDEVQTKEVVDNDYTHPHDACQYLCLGSGDWEAMRHREGRKRHTKVETDWHPHDF